MEFLLPDLGDNAQLPVVELSVAVGDNIEIDDIILTLETDKATLDVPSSIAGVVTEICVKVGDQISTGDVILKIDAAASEQSSQAPAAPQASPEPQSTSSAQRDSDLCCDVLVLGAGPGGYSAAFRSADLGKKVILVERYAQLGGVCLNVGCIPSKALLHLAEIIDAAQEGAEYGVHFQTPKIDLESVVAHKNKVIKRLTEGLAAMAKMRKVKIVTGEGAFLDTQHLSVKAEDGTEQVIRFDKAIIAAGSEARCLPFLPDDPRIMSSTGALKLEDIPEKLLVIGGGIIGMEMATVYAALGSKIDVVEFTPHLMAGADPDLVKVWEKKNLPTFHQVWLETKTTSARAEADGIHVEFESVKTGEKTNRCYDRVLVAVGRQANGAKIGAEHAGIAVDSRGIIAVDEKRRTNVSHIFAIGDIAGDPMLAHKAVHEAHVAAEVAAGDEHAVFDAQQIPSVAYTSPEIAWTGCTQQQCIQNERPHQVEIFPWAASGRAIASGTSTGFTKLIFDPESGRLIGGGIVGRNAGDLIGEICLAIEMGADAVDLAKTIHPHPTLGETVGLCAEQALGVCTDLPPKKG